MSLSWPVRMQRNRIGEAFASQLLIVQMRFLPLAQSDTGALLFIRQKRLGERRNVVKNGRNGLIGMHHREFTFERPSCSRRRNIYIEKAEGEETMCILAKTESKVEISGESRRARSPFVIRSIASSHCAANVRVNIVNENGNEVSGCEIRIGSVIKNTSRIFTHIFSLFYLSTLKCTRTIDTIDLISPKATERERKLPCGLI